MLEIRPIGLKEANEYIQANHRHHGPVVGHKFALSCWDGERLCGVAICGRPVARMADNGFTLEVNRLCTDGTYNSCSILYGAAARVAKAIGYHKIITYILDSEPGTTLKASGWQLETDNVGGRTWNCESRHREDHGPICIKKRWAKCLISGDKAKHEEEINNAFDEPLGCQWVDDEG